MGASSSARTLFPQMVRFRGGISNVLNLTCMHSRATS